MPISLQSSLTVSAAALLLLTVLTVNAAGVSGTPAYPRLENKRSSSIFVHTLNPDEPVKDGVLISNNTDEQKTINVYATDSAKSSGGGFACAQRLREYKKVGTWITMEQDQVVLEPDHYIIVDFTIQIPGGNDEDEQEEDSGEEILSGEYNGCIVVEEEKEQTKQAGVSISFRSATRVAITILGEHNERILKNPGFSVTSGDVRYTEKGESEKIRLKSSVENKGNISVDTRAMLTVRNMFGMTVFKNEVTFPVLPSSEKEWFFDIPKPFLGGKYTADLAFNYDREGTAVGESSSAADEELRAQQTVFYTYPHPAAVLMYVLLFILLLLLFGVYWYCRNCRRGSARRRTMGKKVRSVHKK